MNFHQSKQPPGDVELQSILVSRNILKLSRVWSLFRIEPESCADKSANQFRRRPPNTLPLVGNGFLFLQARHKLFSWFVKCERQFGFETFQISVPTLPPGVVINDPKNLEFVFKNEGVFTKGEFFKTRSFDLFGTSSWLSLAWSELI